MKRLFFTVCAGAAFWWSWEGFHRAYELTKVNDAWASDAFWLGSLWLLMGLRNLSYALKDDSE